MKQKLNYVPWKITLAAAYMPSKEKFIYPMSYAGSEPSFENQIMDGIRKWKRFPVSFGEGEDRLTVYVLLDRIPTPFALLDPKFHLVATAKQIKPSELPKSLRDLYERLQAIGHAK